MDSKPEKSFLETLPIHDVFDEKIRMKSDPPIGNGSLVGGDPRAHIHPPKLLGADSLHATPVENDLDGRFSDGGDWTLCADSAEGPRSRDWAQVDVKSLPQGSQAAASHGHLKELSNCEVGEGGLGKSVSFPI